MLLEQFVITSTNKKPVCNLGLLSAVVTFIFAACTGVCQMLITLWIISIITEVGRDPFYK